MRTADLPIGARVALDTYNGRSYHNFVEAYVIGHRPKGNKSSYWGPSGNTRTVGVMYQRWGRPEIHFDWVTPGQIHMTWDEYTEVEQRSAKAKAEREAADKAAKRDRRKRLSAIPIEISRAAGIDDWRRDDLVDRGSISLIVTVDRLEAIVKAAQDAVPERKAAKVAAEVESALQLLAG
jgi:hypothetical protein